MADLARDTLFTELSVDGDLIEVDTVPLPADYQRLSEGELAPCPRSILLRCPRAWVPPIRRPTTCPACSAAKRHLSDAAELTQFGVVLVTLPPGAWSAQRHWHTHEDEFVWVLSGELVLSTEDGREVLRSGDCAAFKGGVANGHHLVNESDSDAQFLVVGSRMDEDGAEYPDADLRALPGRYGGKGGYATKAGERLE